MPAAFSRVLAFAGAALCLAACATERETTLSRSARAREAAELRTERARLEREMDVLRRTASESNAALATARNDSVVAASTLRTVLAALQIDVERLRRAEQDLAAARTRQQQIAQELAPLHELEAAVRDQEQAREALRGRGAALAAEIETLSKEAAAKDAELQPRLQALRQKVAALQQLGVTLASAEAAIAEALKVVAPPPAPTPAAAPANK